VVVGALALTSLAGWLDRRDAGLALAGLQCA